MSIRSIGGAKSDIEVAASFLPWQLDFTDWVRRIEVTTQTDRHSQLKLRAALALLTEYKPRIEALIIPREDLGE